MLACLQENTGFEAGAGEKDPLSDGTEFVKRWGEVRGGQAEEVRGGQAEVTNGCVHCENVGSSHPVPSFIFLLVTSWFFLILLCFFQMLIYLL